MRVAVSGVSRGIGGAITKALLDRGDSVLGFGREAPHWSDGTCTRFSHLHCDMADHAKLAELCSAVRDPLDVLICNAATFANGAGTIEHFHHQAMSEAFAVNTIAPLIMARGLKERLLDGQYRLIVMVSTGNASLEGNKTGSLLGYRLSKTALNQAVRNLAAEWGPQGFTVIALNPGWVKTDMGGPNAETSVDEACSQIVNFIDHVWRTMPLNGAFVNTDGSPLPW